MNTKNIETMMVLSTAHVSEQTAVAIADRKLYAFVRPEGWLFAVNVALQYGATVPDDLLACLHHAAAHGCDWLMLDCDGEVSEELPQHDW